MISLLLMASVAIVVVGGAIALAYLIARKDQE